MAKVRVTRKQVDAARAEVSAFRAAGLRPDPLVERIARAGDQPRNGVAAPLPQAQPPSQPQP